MTVVNRDAVQFCTATLIDRYQELAYSFTDFTAAAVADGPSWFDWTANPIGSQIAFYGFQLVVNDYNDWDGRFTPLVYLLLRWSLPDRAVWLGSSATLTLHAGITVAGLHDVPQQVSIYGVQVPEFGTLARDTTDNGVYSDPQLVPKHRRYLLARRSFTTGFVLGNQDVTFTFDPSLVNPTLRGAGWANNVVLMVETQRIPLDTANPNLPTALLPIHSPASLPGTPTARITVDEVQLPLVPGRSYWGKSNSRMDACPKCGGTSLRETWVRDGYTSRLVCPRCYDPPVPRNRPARPERPGVNDRG